MAQNSLVKYNHFDIPQECNVYLCQPNRSLLVQLNGIDESSASLSMTFNSLSTFEFNINRYVWDNDTEIDNVWYTYLNPKMEIFVDNIGFFQITSVVVNVEGTHQESKTISCTSIDKELQQKALKYFKVNNGTSDSLEYLVTDTEGNYVNVNPYTNLPYEYITVYKDITVLEDALNHRSSASNRETYLKPAIDAYPRMLLLLGTDAIDMNLSQTDTHGLYKAIQQAVTYYGDNNQSTTELENCLDPTVYTDLTNGSYYDDLCDKIYRYPYLISEDNPNYMSYTVNGSKATSANVKTACEENIKYYQQLSLLDLAIEKSQCGWTVGEVDADLAGKKFVFETDNDMYSFLTQDVAQVVEGIFIFNTMEKTINLYAVQNIGESSDIFIDFNTVQDSLQVTDVNQDQLYTRFYVENDDIDVTYANFGDNYVEDLSWFMNTTAEDGKRNYVDDELAFKYTKWQDYRESLRQEYAEKRAEANQLILDIATLSGSTLTDIDYDVDFSTYSLEELETLKQSYENALAALVTLYKNETGDYTFVYTNEEDQERIHDTIYWYDFYTYYYNLIPNIEVAIANKNAMVDIDYKEDFKTQFDLYGKSELDAKLSSYSGEIDALSLQQVPIHFSAFESVVLDYLENVKGYTADEAQAAYEMGSISISQALDIYLDFLAETKLGDYTTYDSKTAFTTALDKLISSTIRYDTEDGTTTTKPTGDTSYVQYTYYTVVSFTHKTDIGSHSYGEHHIYIEPYTPNETWIYFGDYAVYAQTQANMLDNFMNCWRELQIREYEIAVKQQELDALNVELDEMKDKVLMENFTLTTADVNEAANEGITISNTSFTDDEMQTIHILYMDRDYSNSNILITSLDDIVSYVSVSMDLLEDAKEELSKLSQPQLKYDTTMENLFSIPEFRDYIKNVQLGNYFYIGYKNNQYFKLRLITLSFNPLLQLAANPSLEFANVIKSNSECNDFATILDEAISGGSSGGSSGSSSSGFDLDVDTQFSTNLLNALINTETFGTAVSDVVLSTLTADAGLFQYINTVYASFGGLTGGTTTINGGCITTGYLVSADYDGYYAANTSDISNHPDQVWWNAHANRGNGAYVKYVDFDTDILYSKIATAGTCISLVDGQFCFGGGALTFLLNADHTTYTLSVKGTIYALAGEIGGFSIGDKTLTGHGITLYSDSSDDSKDSNAGYINLTAINGITTSSGTYYQDFQLIMGLHKNDSYDWFEDEQNWSWGYTIMTNKVNDEQYLIGGIYLQPYDKSETEGEEDRQWYKTKLSLGFGAASSDDYSGAWGHPYFRVSGEYEVPDGESTADSRSICAWIQTKNVGSGFNKDEVSHLVLAPAGRIYMRVHTNNSSAKTTEGAIVFRWNSYNSDTSADVYTLTPVSTTGSTADCRFMLGTSTHGWDRLYIQHHSQSTQGVYFVEGDGDTTLLIGRRYIESSNKNVYQVSHTGSTTHYMAESISSPATGLTFEITTTIHTSASDASDSQNAPAYLYGKRTLNDNGTTSSRYLCSYLVYARDVGNDANVYVSSTGALQHSSTASSTKRVKHDIKTANVDMIKGLYDVPFTTFKYNDDVVSPMNRLYDKEVPGIIAEDLLDVLPIAVEYDEDGEVEGYSRNILIPCLLGLIQDLNNRLKVLEGKSGQNETQ